MAYKKGYRKFGPRSYAKKRFTKGDRLRKLAGTQPQTAIQRIANGVGTVATIAKTVSGIVNLINVEDKYKDFAISSTILNTATAYSQVLNSIATGTIRDQRNGNKLLCNSLQIKFQLYMDPVSTVAQMVKLVLLYDKKPQIGAVTGVGTAYSPSSPTGLINKDGVGDRFVILKEWLYVLSPSGTKMVCENHYQKLSRMHVQFFGSTATDFESGAIYLVGISDQAAVAPTIVGNARFIFTDN